MSEIRVALIAAGAHESDAGQWTIWEDDVPKLRAALAQPKDTQSNRDDPARAMPDLMAWEALDEWCGAVHDELVSAGILNAAPAYPASEPLAHGTVPTNAVIAERLRTLSEQLADLGCDMEFLGGVGPMVQQGRLLIETARIARTWAHEIEEGRQG